MRHPALTLPLTTVRLALTLPLPLTKVHLAALAAIVISGGELDHASSGCHDTACHDKACRLVWVRVSSHPVTLTLTQTL